MDSQCHRPAGTRVFEGIGQEIAQRFVQAEFIANQTLLGHIKRVEL